MRPSALAEIRASMASQAAPDRQWPSRRAAGVWLSMALGAASVGAQPVVIGVPDCVHGARLVVRDVAKSDVLRQLAQAWNFRLDIDDAPLAAVRIDAVGRPDELVVRLLQSDSFMLLRKPDPRCPGRMTIARLFVIGPSAMVARPRDLNVVRTAEPEPSAEAAELVDNYRRSHGIPAVRPDAASR